MAISSPRNEDRARAIALSKVILDLLLAAALVWSDAPRATLLFPALDVVVTFAGLRLFQRYAAGILSLFLALSAALIAWIPFALQGRGLAAWALLTLIPAGASYARLSRSRLRQVTLVTVGLLLAGVLAWQRNGLALPVDAWSVPEWAGAIGLSVFLHTLLLVKNLQDIGVSKQLLAEPLSVVRGVMVAAVQRSALEVPVDALRAEIETLQRQHSLNWLVLDLGAGGDLSDDKIQDVEQAIHTLRPSQCTVVLARASADAIGQLDVAQPAIRRVERFATVAQAVEVGLRRLGWEQAGDPNKRLVTTY